MSTCDTVYCYEYAVNEVELTSITLSVIRLTRNKEIFLNRLEMGEMSAKSKFSKTFDRNNTN